MATTLASLRRRLRTKLNEDYALTTPGAPLVSPQGTPGASTITYKITATNSVGESDVSQGTTITNGAATLNGTNYNQLTWTAVPGATGYNIYRTATNGTSPTTLGLIGTSTLATKNDTGLAGDASTAPTINTSGLTSPYWTEQELLDILIDGCKDLWRSIIELHQGHFVTIDITNVTLQASATTLSGVPTDTFRILAIEPLDVSDSSSTSNIVFTPLTYKSRTFESIRGISAASADGTGVIYYDVMNAGSPVAAPTVVIGPPITSALSIRFTYVHTLSSSLDASSNNPIPGESDNALLSWGMAWARAKESGDRQPDEGWLACYATDKRSLMVALTPREEQETEHVEAIFESYW